MARNTGPGHDKSDRALDKAAFDEEPRSNQHWSADEVRKHDDTGRDRLFEGREQHDEADLNSEKNRLSRDINEHDHVRENFQVQGGAKNVRVESRHAINPGHPDEPQPGGDAPRPERVRDEGSS